jgi:pimeloyl-ACP methyl ester carboxylesterase
MTCLPVRCGCSPQIGYLEAGDGETVLLLHGSATTGAMWRGVIPALQPLYRVVAPDLIGYGTSAAWPADVPFDLDAEARALAPLLPCCAAGYHLIGYSYGGAVALHMALANPARVRTLTLIEPVFVAALRYGGERLALDQFMRIRDRFVSTLPLDRSLAMQLFLAFWVGDGTWDRLPPAAQGDMLNVVDKIRLDWKAVFATDPGDRSLALLGERTLLVRGDQSPAPMLRLVDTLHHLMPGSGRTVVGGANHLLPVTHGPALTEAILLHLHADAERRLR